MNDFDGTGDYIEVPDKDDWEFPKERWWMRGPFRNWNNWSSTGMWVTAKDGKKYVNIKWEWSNPIRMFFYKLALRTKRK